MVSGARNISVHTTKSPKCGKQSHEALKPADIFTPADAIPLSDGDNDFAWSVLLTVAFQLLVFLYILLYIFVFHSIFIFAFFKTFPLASKTR
jgi:hypothetical protein